MIEPAALKAWVESLTYMPGWSFKLLEPSLGFPEHADERLIQIVGVVPNSWYPEHSTAPQIVLGGAVNVYPWYEIEHVKMGLEDAIDRLHLHERKEWLRAGGQYLSEPHDLDGAFTTGRR